MQESFRKFLRFSAISIGIVVIHLILCRFIMPIGYFTLISTTFALEIIERIGLPTLKGSPQGFPVMTELGWAVAILLWWSIWLLLVYTWSDAIKKSS